MIAENTIEKIKATAKVIDIAESLLELKVSGSSKTCACPKCGAENKLSITPSKDMAKCFVCDIGAKGAINFLTKFYDKSYIEAIKHCAEQYNVPIEEDDAKGQRAPDAPSFRDLQLKESGILIENIQCQLIDGTEIERYESGRIGKAWKIEDGDDMVLNYVDLEGNRMTYTHPITKKKKPFQRIRYRNPEEHLNKAGKATKYMQPKGSGSYLWMPELIRTKYQNIDTIDTLIVTEGEKKADKLCSHGLFAVAIMGIHNLSIKGEMSEQFGELIRSCEVKNIVLLFDADWQDLRIKEAQSVSSRPYSFFKSAKKFKDYFYHYNSEGLHLNIYLSYIKPNDNNDKGADDLLTNTLKEKEDELTTDFTNAINDREGIGSYVNCHEITSLNDYQLKEFWGLHDNQAFANLHLEELKPLDKFKHGKFFWRIENDEIVMAQKLLPSEQYWKEVETKNSSGNTNIKHKFDYQNIRTFLRNRQIGKYFIDNDRFIFIKSENRIVLEVNHHYIIDYVIDFTERIKEPEVLGMLLGGGSQYLGPEKLSRMYPFDFDFMESDIDSQYYFFKNTFWKITADSIAEKPFSQLHGHIWNREQIDADPTLLEQKLFEISRANGKFEIQKNEKASNCHLFEFLMRTSFFNWEKGHELKHQAGGTKKWSETNNFGKVFEEEEESLIQHFVSKILAIGYLSHTYQNIAEAKGIICMDGKESAVGESNGGTGKSIFGQIVSYMLPTTRIDAKNTKQDDPFIYEEIDEHTKVIYFDDCRRNMDFEAFFGQITSAITVNKKGGRRFSRPAPKFVFTTNHAIRGEGNSFNRRQYSLSFSDWYNEYRTPKDDFGCILFNDWDDKQWNLYYNFIACCVQTYLKFGLQYTIPMEDLQRRKLRDDIGESFLDWANLHFSDTANFNTKIDKKVLYQGFAEAYPKESNYCNIGKFKKRMKKFCTYKGLIFNPTGQKGAGTDIKTGGTEYFLIADGNFTANETPLL